MGLNPSMEERWSRRQERDAQERRSRTGETQEEALQSIREGKPEVVKKAPG